MSDLLYYKELNESTDVRKGNLISQITTELTRIEALKIEGTKTVLTGKGKFIVQMNLKGLTAAFLYECIRLGIKELGVAAATVLNTKNLFRQNVELTNPSKN